MSSFNKFGKVWGYGLQPLFSIEASLLPMPAGLDTALVLVVSLDRATIALRSEKGNKSLTPAPLEISGRVAGHGACFFETLPFNKPQNHWNKTFQRDSCAFRSMVQNYFSCRLWQKPEQTVGAPKIHTKKRDRTLF